MSDTSDKIVIYPAKDGRPDIRLRVEDGTVWLTQAEIAELFGSSTANINIHIKNILEDGEQPADSVIKESLITAVDGKNYRTKLYRLEMILAVGYRVRGPRGVQFRQWATANLSEYLVKGFVMNDERLKNPGGFDYFDELLARIREIRASEKRFYQKVRDLFALSTDYRNDPEATAVFFAETQNKLLYAVTQKTAAELIVARADTSQPNMALQAWSGSRVRKLDVIVAKNYLAQPEIDTLNRLVSLFLDQAELRVTNGKPLTLDFWRGNVESLIRFSDFPVLEGAGSISHERAKAVVEERYDRFDEARRAAEATAADADDIRALEDAEKQLAQPNRKVGKKAEGGK
jgi:hypothetical protein